MDTGAVKPTFHVRKLRHRNFKEGLQAFETWNNSSLKAMNVIPNYVILNTHTLVNSHTAMSLGQP